MMNTETSSKQNLEKKSDIEEVKGAIKTLKFFDYGIRKELQKRESKETTDEAH